MKFSTLIALVGTASATKIMKKTPSETTPVELAQIEEGESTNEGESAETEATAEAYAEGVSDYETKKYNYPIEEQNFNGILGMLGTPTSMTT